jgi:hypothetical protein
MRLLGRIKSRRKTRTLAYAQGKLEGKPSPFREGAPEKSQSHSGGATEARFIP